MRFADAARTLRSLPAELPDGRDELTPLLLARIGDRPMPVADLPRATRDSAVLVLLYPDTAGEAFVLLIERTSGDFRHSGEVGFPGGALDPDDVSMEAAALREAREEVGLDSDAVELVGRLDAVEIRVSGFRLTPVVGLLNEAPRDLVPDAREVAAILEVPVRTFLPGAPVEIVEAERGGFRLRYGAFRLGEYRIWGATAKVLGQLGAVLGNAGA